MSAFRLAAPRPQAQNSPSCLLHHAMQHPRAVLHCQPIPTLLTRPHPEPLERLLLHFRFSTPHLAIRYTNFSAFDR